MFVTMTLAAALLSPSAPLPKDIATAGPAPRVLELKPNSDGKITLTVLRQTKEKRPVAVGRPAIAPVPPQPAGGNAVAEREVTVSRYVTIELADLKDLKVTTAGGKTVDAKDAIKQLEKGGVVVTSTDGKPVDSGFLKIFREDTLVLVSPDLITIQATSGTPSTGGVIRPGVLPRPLPAVIPPGGIQVQPLPGVLPGGAVEIQILPAQPVPAPEKPAVEKK
jgi:hypothetical protein